jgi:hypothetical protein
MVEEFGVVLKDLSNHRRLRFCQPRDTGRPLRWLLSPLLPPGSRRCHSLAALLITSVYK